jgi:oligoribonuclease NrnB/cAMP/cGMP phosphodiesterase (DHH superfamily)
MKTVVVYHSIDLDGWMSAAIVKHWFTLEVAKRSELRNEDMTWLHKIDFIGYNYGQPIPDLSEYDKVIMCDVSFPKDIMMKLFTDNKLTWIDHHISINIFV